METNQHYHESTKAVLNRMSRAIGHFQSVKIIFNQLKTVEDNMDCSDILIQIFTVKAEIESISKVV